MNNGYLQRVIEWRDKAKHDGTWGSTNVSGMYPYEVIDTLIDQLAEARELHSKTYDEYQRLLAEARAEVAELKATIQPGCCGIATCPGVAAAHRSGWEQCKKQIIAEWEKPYGLTDGSQFIARLRGLEYKEKADGSSE